MADNAQLAVLRQALDDAVLTHTGRSIGDLASDRVLIDILPEIEALDRAQIASLETRYEEQGQYNHQLVRRLADMMEIVKAVAEDKRWQILPADDDRQYCMWCGVARSDPVHQGFCPVTKARALLSEDE